MDSLLTFFERAFIISTRVPTAEKRDIMSRKSRERREKNKSTRPDDYFFNGVFEMAALEKIQLLGTTEHPHSRLHRWSICVQSTLLNMKLSQKRFLH